MLQAEASVALTVLLLNRLVGIQHHLYRVAAQRMRHDLVAALVQFQHEFLVFLRRISKRRNHSAAAICEKFHKIRGDPVVVIKSARLFKIGQKFWR